MKSQVFVVSFASILLTLPGWTQQQAKGPAGAPQTVSRQNSSGHEPLTAGAPRDFWDGDEPNLVNLMSHPFASKAYVGRQTRPIHDRLNELDKLTSENSRMIKDADSRSQRALQLASEKSSLADQHATEALNRSQLAKTAAMEASMRISAAEQTVATLGEYKGGAQTEIRFRGGHSVLSKHARAALDAIAGPLGAQQDYIIEIRGFAPGRGRVANTNAKKMSDSIVRYLVLTHKIPMHRISVLNMATGRAAKSRRVGIGRVDISVLQKPTTTMARR
jgi:outer membrane protein OmpA-like peptidoglycan-associated protein